MTGFVKLSSSQVQSIEQTKQLSTRDNKRSMIHQLKKAWPNAGTIWKAGVPLVAVAMAALKKRNIHLPWPVEGNEACLDTWPPETNCVVDLLPIGLVCLSIILAVNLASFLMETPNESAQKNIQIQHERRHTNIEEMVAEVEGSEDWESNEIGQVQFKKLHHALIDLVELPAFDKTTLERGVQCGWAMFEKELRIGIDKTKEDRDVEYAGGDKLNKLVSSYDDFYALARREGLVQEKADRKRLWKLVKEGRHTVRCVERKGVHKALQLLWLVRKSLGWLVLETLAAMLSAIMTALSVYYRAEVLDTIQVGGEAFWLATRAMVLVQLTASLLNLVTKTLESRGRGKVAHDVKVKYFEALIRRDLDWWATMAKEGKDPSWSIWELDTQVKAFLEIPQSFSENLSTLITHSLLVLRTSSRSFYLLLFLNFGSPLLLWLLAKLTNKLRPILMRGLVLPHYDLETWMYAVDPQYVATFQSFGRSKKECLSFKENDRSWLTYQKRECLLDVMEDPIAAFLSASLDATQIHISGQLISSGQARLPEAQVLMKSSEEVSETVEVSWSLFKGIVEKAQPLAKVYDLCTLPTTINPDAGIYPTQKTRGKIEFKNVKFSYPGRKVPVLKGINFDVRPGQTVGITGKAGCGYVFITLSSALGRLYLCFVEPPIRLKFSHLDLSSPLWRFFLQEINRHEIVRTFLRRF